MQAVEAVYERGKITLIKPYDKINETDRVVVLFMNKNESSAAQERSIALAKLQESTGFVQEILANPAEDVWNDI